MNGLRSAQVAQNDILQSVAPNGICPDFKPCSKSQAEERNAGKGKKWVAALYATFMQLFVSARTWTAARDLLDGIFK